MARSWAVKRKIAYIGSIFAVLALIIIVPMYIIWSGVEPTCSDGTQNQNELGIDCGGECQRLCAHQTVEPNILWSRAFRVSEGIYNLVAYIENPNFNAAAQGVPFQFRVLDENNVLIAEEAGVTYISPRLTFPVFKATVQTGERIPNRTFFSFTSDPEWYSVEDAPQQSLSVRNRRVEAPNSSPRVTAVVENGGVESINDVEVTAVVFNTDGNAMASSRTVIGTLEARSEQEVVFTWPEPFPRTVSRVDVVPRVPPPERTQ